MFTNLIKLQYNDAYFKNRIITHNRSEINNTFLFPHEMSIAVIYRPLNFFLLMQHTRPCYIVGHGSSLESDILNFPSNEMLSYKEQ